MEEVTQTGHVQPETEAHAEPDAQKNLPPHQCKSYTDTLSDPHFTFLLAPYRGASHPLHETVGQIAKGRHHLGAVRFIACDQ